MYNPYDRYFKKAKKEWFKARSVYKLEEIDKKYNIFTRDTKNILDIWCAPWSWIQYIWKRLNELKVNDFNIIWFDLKPVNLNLSGVFTYIQDATKLDQVENIIRKHWISKFDVITSDMAPNTIGIKDIDAIRSVKLLKQTLPIYQRFLKLDWKFVIKVFMWPGFDDFVREIKSIFWGKKIKIFKPQATRKNSKEVYIIRY